MKIHTKQYGVYHWDTFDDEVLLVEESDSLDEMLNFVNQKYKDRISEFGADTVEIVGSHGKIIAKFSVK